MLGAGLLWLLFRFPGYAPLQRFESLRRGHARVLQALRAKALQP
jgi:hypothetical protein